MKARWNARRYARGVLIVLPLLSVLPQSAFGADAAVYGVLKSQQFFQTNAAAPVAPASNGFAFNAFVQASGDHLVTNATVDPSNSTPQRQLLGDSSQAVWRFEERFNTQSELNAVYPSGTVISPATYTVTMKAVHDGMKTVSLSLGAFGSPPTLQVTNFASAQAIIPATDFTLRWSSAGGLSSDIVQLTVRDSASNTVFASPEPLAPGALSGQSNSIVIPASVLPPVAHFTARLSITRPLDLDMNSYPGATGLSALVKDIEFPLATRTLPARPRLEILSVDANPFQFRYTGEPNLIYQIQVTDNFTSWTTLFVTNSPTGTGTYSDPASPERNRRYYRIQLGE